LHPKRNISCLTLNSSMKLKFVMRMKERKFNLNMLLVFKAKTTFEPGVTLGKDDFSLNKIINIKFPNFSDTSSYATMGIAPEKGDEKIQRSHDSNSDEARLESVVIETVATVHESCSPKDTHSMDSFEAVLESTRLVELTHYILKFFFTNFLTKLGVLMYHVTKMKNIAGF